MYGQKRLEHKQPNVLILLRMDPGVHDPRRLHDQVQTSPISTQWTDIHQDPQNSFRNPTSRLHCSVFPPKTPRKI